MFGSCPGLCMCLIKQTQVSEPFMVAGAELVKISHLWEKKKNNCDISPAAHVGR